MEGEGAVDRHHSLFRRLCSVLCRRLGERVPASLRGGLLDPGRRAVGALAIVGVLASLVAAAYLLRSRPEPVAAPGGQPLAASQPSPAPTHQPQSRPTVSPTASPTASPDAVVVDVDGKVSEPGVYTLAPDSRVVDAVRKAGGLDQGADTAGVNLARRLEDGEKILVGVPRQPGLGGAQHSSGSGGSSGPAGSGISLNEATAEQLQQLPGVGEVLAGRIVEYRANHGGVNSVSELTDVRGIGEATLADIEDRVRR